MSNIKFKNDWVAIRELKVGTVIEVSGVGHPDGNYFGHIVGFSRNCVGEFLIIAKIEKRFGHSDCVNREYHPSCLIVHF